MLLGCDIIVIILESHGVYIVVVHWVEGDVTASKFKITC